MADSNSDDLASVHTQWVSNPDPMHLAIPAHGNSVVTCMILARGRLITASDDRSIHVYAHRTGTRIHMLSGHGGGVWAMATTKNMLVSGSTDRTVRVWDLETGRNTHIFVGHTSTVRSIAIVKPELIEYENEEGTMVREEWPKQPLIVSGSRDHSLRVWTLPRSEDQEHKDDPDAESPEGAAETNPYHHWYLEGHTDAVRALAVRGRIAVSGSYDTTVRVWDIMTGACKATLQGHTSKVYAVVLDMKRCQAYSGSLDHDVRIWNYNTAQCLHVLSGHSSLAGLLALSPSNLVSASADATLRVWNPDTGEPRHTLAHHNAAVTCFQHDDHKVVSGSDGTLKMWDIRDGSLVRELLTGAIGVWQVVFKGLWCAAAASTLADNTAIHIWYFGRGEEERGYNLDDESDLDG